MPPTPRRGITGVQKQALRAWAKGQEHRPSHAQSCAWFERTYGRHLSQSTCSEILSKKFDHLDSVTGDAANLLRQRAPQWPLLEQQLFEWLDTLAPGATTPAEVLTHKAREIWNRIPEYQTLPVPHFSNGWMGKFRKRYTDRVSARPAGGALTAAPMQTTRKEMKGLRAMAGEFHETDIYNMDEMGLFWRKPPVYLLSSQDPWTTSRENSRVCVMACTNSTGSDRLPLWMIGHSQMPQALSKINLEAMDCHWRYNTHAWLTRSLMQEWLLFFYRHVGDRRVLLLLDQNPDHQAAIDAVPPPPNVHIQLFPKQTNQSAEQQPLSLGIVQALKHWYRKYWLTYLVSGLSTCENLVHKMNLYRAMCWITRSWRHDLANATINRAFRRSSLLDPQLDYISAPRLPDLTALYNTIVQNNRGLAVISLENFTHPLDEDFETHLGNADDAGEALNEQIRLDEPILPVPAHDTTPPAQDAGAGLQTAINYLLHQPWTTASDIQSLERVERIINRFAIDEKGKGHAGAFN
ncbi:hypothetical protein PENANT_c015G07895 [Penicillium antarcticum]|uniref:HTH CENPB-type domain-containing protein n=1 Tax=Penicillium antarcticum TaxID=416450 RepID=A0A1V6Q483_9EURO|nr:hypothetical protein PENANT_c015G07895 [Penicillium antarcticum]